MSSKRSILWLGLAAMAWAVAGCSGDSDSPVAASILSFQSSPSEIESGRWATLSWETANANKVEIVEVGGEPIALGGAAASRGSVQVSPAVTTQYELRAFGKGSGVASQLTTVNVVPKAEAPTIVSFVANPEHISLGDTVVLSWMTTAAETVRISDATGATITVADGVEATEGEVSLKPRGSTTYHLVATGQGGQVEAEVAVGVHGQPAVTFKAPTQPIEPGGEAVLQWSATHANHVTITDEAGAVVYDGAELEGQVTVQSQETTVYTAVARNEASEGSARATVAVQPVIDVFEAYTERPVYPGEQVEVRWKVRGAKEVTVTRFGLDPWVAPEDARAEGSVTLPVGNDGSFRLRARSGALSTEALASVTMENVPRIKEFSIAPALVSADENHPATVTISWSIDGASHLQLEGDDGQKVPVAGVSPRADSIEVQVRGTTTFRLSATNEHGVSVAERQVTATRTPAIDTFVALPSVAAVGEEIQLFWETSDAVAVAIEKVGAGRIGDELPLDGSMADSILAEASYVLRTWNSLGYETVSEPISVTIGNPEILQFTADRFFVRPNLPVTLTWRNIGGQELVITDQSGVEILDLEGKKCSTRDPFRIGAGSCVIPGPAVGEHTLTLALRNGLSPATETTATVDLESVSGPVITSFVIEGSPNTVGVPLSLRWETTEDIAGNGALFELSADGEVFHTTAAPSLAGSLDHAFSRQGVQQVVLRAFSSEGEHRATRTVDIRGVASIDAFEASPVLIDSTVDPLVTNLSWAFQHGRTARIHQVAADGSHIEPPVMVLDGEGENAVGGRALDVTPGIHRFALVVDNQAGSRAEAEALVEVDLAEATISVNKTDVMPGNDTVTLTWDTKHASEITITPLPMNAPFVPVARETTAQFVDVRELPEFTEHPLVGSDDSGHAEIVLPEGFAFPYDGEQRTALRAWIDGVISFDLTGAGGGSNVVLPYTGSNATQKRAHMALFWRDLHAGRPGNPRGTIQSALSADERGPFFAVQWSGVHPWAAASHPADFNFQAILRPNGVFEYRYGSMTSKDQSHRGFVSTVGFQNLSGTAGFTVSHNTAREFANRSWAFEAPSIEASGTMEVPMARSASFSVWARNAYSAASDSTEEVVFWNKPVITASAPAEVVVGQEFTITWSATHSTAVEIVSAADPGVVLCEAASSDGTQQTLQGECSISNPEGLYTYVVRAVGGLESNTTEREITVKSYRPFALERFAAEPASLMPGETTTLSWRTVGAASYVLTANGEEVSIPQDAVGQLVLAPATTTNYTLVIKDAPGGGLDVRTLTSSVNVVVRSTTMDDVSLSQSQFGAGSGPQRVTVTWSSTGADGVEIEGLYGFHEIDDPTRFVDIASVETALARTQGSVDDGGYLVPMPTGFTYDGAPLNTITVSTNGWIGMNSISTGFVPSNSALPSTTNSKVQLAPFWDDLNPSSVYKAEGVDPELGRYVVFQWDTRIDHQFESSLQFQAVLFENGWFEYRYGPMSSEAEGRAEGSSATIGYQNRAGTRGYAISYNEIVAGGLTGKTFRFMPVLPGSGSADVIIGGSGDISVCAFDDGHRECKGSTVTFIAPNAFRITEIMVNPAGGPAAQWVEVRNITGAELNLKDFSLENGTGQSHTFTADLMVPAGGFAVLARSDDSANGNIGADAVYGDIPFDPTGGTVTLALGRAAIDSITWTADWELPLGASLSLDGSYHLPEGANSTHDRWCTSSEELATGGFGSPGYLGEGCRSAWYTMDWASARPFIDIASSGEPIDKLNVDSAHDTAAQGRPIGFPFPFFGETFTEWFGSSNGFLAFTGLTDSFSTGADNFPRTDRGPFNVVSAFWNDLQNQTGSSVKTELISRDGQQVRIVQWTGTKIWGQTGAITFQIQLWSNGDIVLAYKDITGAVGSVLDRYLGSRATIGIQDATGENGYPFSVYKPWLFEGRVLVFEKK